jgi:hypothetical protein
MATFQLTDPSGGTYEIDAPDENAAVNALSQLHGGATPAQAPPAGPSSWADVGKTIPAGLMRGETGMAGMLPDFAGLLKAGANKLFDLGLGPIPDKGQQAPNLQNTLGSAALQKDVASVAPSLDYQPQTTAGKYANTIAEMLPGAILPGEGTLGSRLVKYAAVPGAASEFAGEATQGTAAEPWARIAGALAAPLGVGGIMNWFSPEASTARIFNKALPADAGATMAKLGPDAMMLDTSPQMLGLAQGAGVKPGQATDLLVNALRNRQAGQSDRLMADLGNIGPAVSPTEAEGITTASKAATGPMYDAAYDQAQPVDLSGVLRQIAQDRPTAGPLETQALDTSSNWLTQPLTMPDGSLLKRVPIDNARKIGNTAKEIDQSLTYPVKGFPAPGALPAAQGAMYNVRTGLKDALHDQVPGLDEADKAWQTAAQIGEAYNSGRSLLAEKGMWPDEALRAYEAATPAEQASMRSGALSHAYETLGRTSNDLVGMKRVFGGENDFNRAKAAMLFGPDNRDAAIAGINREGQFSDAYNKVAQNSQTAQRLAGSKAIDEAAPNMSDLVPKNTTTLGFAGHYGVKGLQAAYGKFTGATNQETRMNLAKALTGRNAARMVPPSFRAGTGSVDAWRVALAAALAAGH